MKHSLSLAAAAIAAVAYPAAMATSSIASPADQAQDFARCAVKNYEGAELLATQPGSPEEADVLAEFRRRACAAPSSQSNVLRGAVAEQLFKADFGSIGSRARRDLIEVFTVDLDQFESLDPNSKRQLNLLGFGTCVAASDPAKAVELLQTRSGSPEEAKIISDLQPKFAPCLAQGETLDFQKYELRGALAESAYRLALAQSLNQDIVVTGTKDPARSVVCKMHSVAGSRFRQQTCLTVAQWKDRERDDKIASEDIARRALEYDERKTACVTRANFSDQACSMK